MMHCMGSLHYNSLFLFQSLSFQGYKQFLHWPSSSVKSDTAISVPDRFQTSVLYIKTRQALSDTVHESSFGQPLLISPILFSV